MSHYVSLSFITSALILETLLSRHILHVLYSLTMFCLLDFGGCALVLAAVYGDKTYRKVKILAGVLSIQLRQCWDNSNLGLKPYK